MVKSSPENDDDRYVEHADHLSLTSNLHPPEKSPPMPLTPLSSTLTKRASVTPLSSTLTRPPCINIKTRDFKSCSIHTYEVPSCKSCGINTYKKWGGVRAKVPGGITREGVQPQASTREPRVEAQGTFDLPSAARIESARTGGFAGIGRPKRSGTMRNGLFLGVAAILLWFAPAE